MCYITAHLMIQTNSDRYNIYNNMNSCPYALEKQKWLFTMGNQHSHMPGEASHPLLSSVYKFCHLTKSTMYIKHKSNNNRHERMFLFFMRECFRFFLNYKKLFPFKKITNSSSKSAKMSTIMHNITTPHQPVQNTLEGLSRP